MERAQLTVAHVVADCLPDPVLALVPELVGVLQILRDIPHIIPNHPSRVADFLEEALRLLRALLERRSENGASKSRKAEKRESTHSD